MKRKSQLNLNNNGYLQIDFAFAIFIFFIFFIIIYVKYDNFYSSQINVFNENKVIFSARDICFLIINSQGSPKNWGGVGSDFEMIGLKNFNNFSLNSTKLLYYNPTNYFDILDSFGGDIDFLKIKIDGINTSNNYLNFGVDYISDNYYSTYNCYSNYNSEIVRVQVGVMKS